MHSYKSDHCKIYSGFKMAESWIQTTQFLNQWETWAILKENNKILKYRHLWNIHAHILSRTHTPTYFTQCQIKITQGNFQGCIYNHNDKNSIFEVAEVKEQTTARRNRCSHSHRAHSLETRYHVRRGVCWRGTCSTGNEFQWHWRPD